MKNFWLEKRGPKKTKINIWLGTSITGGEEELLGEVTAVTDELHDRICADSYITNAKMVIPHEIDKMLWEHRIGKALCKRNEPFDCWNTSSQVGTNENDLKIRALPIEVKKAQWTVPPGCKLFKQFGDLYIKEDKPYVSDKALQIASRIWCDQEMKNIPMDIETVNRIAMVIDTVIKINCSKN